MPSWTPRTEIPKGHALFWMWGLFREELGMEILLMEGGLAQGDNFYNKL